MTGPRVLHIDTATEWRGGQQQLAYLLEARPRDLWAGVPGSPLAMRTRAPDVVLRPGNDPRNLFTLYQAFPGLGVPLIAAHTPHALGLAVLAQLPVVAHRRVDFQPSGVWKYLRARGVVAVSEGVKRILARVGVPRERVRVVHDGVRLRADAAVDPAWLAGLPRPWYLAVGALVDHKGHRYAVEALRQVPGSLLVAGEGPLAGDLRERAAAAGVTQRVRWLGTVAEPGGLFAACDALVHPSVEEGMGQVLVEAMGAGMRVVATTAGGIPEVVGEAGELVPPGDVGALAGALSRVLIRPLGEGRVRAAAFSVEAMVAGTASAYAAFLGDGPAARDSAVR